LLPNAIVRSNDQWSTHSSWSKSMNDVQKLQTIGINITSMKKGDSYSRQQVEDAFYILESDVAEKVAAFERGERQDPMSFALNKLKVTIEKNRADLGLPPLVMRSQNGGLRVLTDSEAGPYLNAQANAGLRKHKNKTAQLFTHVDASQLDEKDKKQLDADQRRHAFIAAAAQGARTQSLKMQRKGLQLPKYDQ
tara:strand:- start:204 stop:782 length:579 start_codon:yes stop_codon:yes gene_type:complete